MQSFRRSILLFILIMSGSYLFSQYQPVIINQFQIGADLSLAKSIIDKGGIYYADDKKADLFETFKNKKFEYARLRLFHKPDGLSSNGTVNSMPYTIALAKVIKASGMKLLLDFHYSDTWADPSKQTKPAAWSNLNFTTLNDSVYAYTKITMNIFAENGVYPDMVQAGNEISHGMLWPDGASWTGNKSNYRNFSTLLKSAIRGIRESDNGSGIPILLHAATGGSLSDTRIFIDSLVKYNVEFDAIGLSYYIEYHGIMSQLDENIAYLNSHYNQNIIIAETNYRSDGILPSGSVITQSQLPFPLTLQGQYDYLQALYRLTKKYPKVKGIYYWGGELIWAGDIGGSYSSLFNWDGKARKALNAFQDLATGGVSSPNSTSQVTIFLDSDSHLEIRSNAEMSPGNILKILDLEGRTIYQKPLTGNVTQLDLKSTPMGLYVVEILNKGNILFSEKVLLK